MAKPIFSILAGEQRLLHIARQKAVFCQVWEVAFWERWKSGKKTTVWGAGMSMTTTEVGKWDWSLETLLGILAVFSTWETYPECFRG